MTGDEAAIKQLTSQGCIPPFAATLLSKKPPTELKENNVMAHRQPESGWDGRRRNNQPLEGITYESEESSNDVREVRRQSTEDSTPR